MSWWALILAGLTAGFLLAFLISRLRFNILHFICIVGFSSAYVGGAVLFINCMFDDEPVEVVTDRNPDAGISPRTFTVKLKQARPYGLTQLRLNSFNRRDTSEGICVRVYRGGLFLGWYTIAPYRDCPGASSPMDDAMIRSAQPVVDAVEMRCFKGDLAQCERQCASGKKYLSCANQDWLIMGRGWTVSYWTQGSGLDGHYSANVDIRCTVQSAAQAQSAGIRETCD